mgnify:CR=1 FL=1
MSDKEIKGKVHSIQSLAATDGPGVRFAVFLQGCNLRCGCCHNPDTWNISGGTEYTPYEIVEKAVLDGRIPMSRIDESAERVLALKEKIGLFEDEKEEIDINVKTLYVEAYAREHKSFSFRKLLEKQSSKMEVIVTFLIILELMKTGKINISQEDIFDDILITSNVA